MVYSAGLDGILKKICPTGNLTIEFSVALSLMELALIEFQAKIGENVKIYVDF